MSTEATELSLFWVEGDLSIYRYPAGTDITLPEGELVSVTRAPGEVSLIVPSTVSAPEGWGDAAGPYRAFAVRGPLDLSMTGIMAALSVPLATAGVPIFALSTYDTDYVLVKAEMMMQCEAALVGEGHRFV